MANIIKNDVETYVRELIASELGSNNNKENILSNDQTLDKGDDWDLQSIFYMEYWLKRGGF